MSQIIQVNQVFDILKPENIIDVEALVLFCHCLRTRSSRNHSSINITSSLILQGAADRLCQDLGYI
jgi:hypothetical protein